MTNFNAHVRFMHGFHARYMVANKVCRYWAAMVRELDPEWIVPQHGAPMKGREVIAQFLHWIENLDCGIDLMSRGMYVPPVSVNIHL